MAIEKLTTEEQIKAALKNKLTNKDIKVDNLNKNPFINGFQLGSQSSKE